MLWSQTSSRSFRWIFQMAVLGAALLSFHQCAYAQFTPLEWQSDAPPLWNRLFIFPLGTNGSDWITATSAAGADSANQAAALQPQVTCPWTAVGSTGVVDESVPSTRYAFTDACVEYRAVTADTGQIVLRYNVVNTCDNGANPNIPGWTKLELGYTAPGASTVEATLFLVKPCTGEQRPVCTITGTANVPSCAHCTFQSGAIDFSSYLYYVRVVLRRTHRSQMPRACTLRLL